MTALPDVLRRIKKDPEDPYDGCRSYTSAAVLDVVRRVVQKPAKLHAPLLGEREKQLVAECVESGQVTHGPRVEEFEGRIKALTKAKHAVAVSSGTAALHLALLAAGVGPGDNVVVPSFTFVATANAVRYCGAVPQFVDCDECGGLDPEKLDEWLKGNVVKAVVCVHSFGTCCDMLAMTEVCRRHGVVLIEDAAQAIGSYERGQHAGTFGLLGSFSFNGNKTITTGGGGCVVTDDPGIAKRVRRLAAVAKEDIQGEFWHSEIGFNYRMPNINAALGCGQMENFYSIRGLKRILAARYAEAFASCPVAGMIGTRKRQVEVHAVTGSASGKRIAGEMDESNHWLNAIILREPGARKETAAALDRYGFECRLGWTPLHYLPMYRCAERGDLSVTESLAKSIINLPSGPGIVS